ncbi:hypothetical protein M3Y98_00862700 [Aphelenchoides besseyi]|nr:hypothetical protein M3Y98_00862700 [Aphelenchoides besseyi]KAI6211193.1 hypothetical protein M3Y96_00407900 [Aphelenchoides besseyi]
MFSKTEMSGGLTRPRSSNTSATLSSSTISTNPAAQSTVSTESTNSSTLTEEEQKEKVRQFDDQLNEMSSEVEVYNTIYQESLDVLNYYDRLLLENQNRLETFNLELNTLEDEKNQFAHDTKQYEDMIEAANQSIVDLKQQVHELDDLTSTGEQKPLKSIAEHRHQTRMTVNEANDQFNEVENQLSEAMEMLAELQNTEDRIKESEVETPDGVLGEIRRILKIQLANVQKVETETDQLTERVQHTLSRFKLNQQT